MRAKLPVNEYLTMQIASQINELSDGAHFKHKGNYALIAEKVKQYIPAWHIALERLFQLIIFNYFYGNDCAHLKNFSL